MQTSLKVIILGVLIALLAVVAEQLAAAAAQIFLGREIVFSFYQNLGLFLVLAVLIEEGLKYSALQWGMRARLGLSGKKLVLGSFFLGISFGLTEIGLILFSDPETANSLRSFDRETIFILSSILSIQTVTALLMGSMIAVQGKKRYLAFAKILFFPVLIHLLYNFLIIQKGSFTNYLVVLVLGISFFVSLIIIVFNYQGLD